MLLEESVQIIFGNAIEVAELDLGDFGPLFHNQIEVISSDFWTIFDFLHIRAVIRNQFNLFEWRLNHTSESASEVQPLYMSKTLFETEVAMSG